MCLIAVIASRFLGWAAGPIVTTIFLMVGPGCAVPGRAPPAASGESFGLCGPDGLVDDCEDGNGQIKVIGQRGGFWYTFADSQGTTIVPEAVGGAAFQMSAGGVNASKLAANMRGRVANGKVVYGGMGVNLTDPRGLYDASAYKGVAFWAKRGPGSYEYVRFKIPDASTDEAGGVCTDCSNDFGIDLALTESWQQYAVPWKALKQLPAWGAPRPRSIKPNKIYSLQWQVNRPGATFDVWVDDIELIGCD